jgi:hypothetical protein
MSASQGEKARRWDQLLRWLADPGVRDVHVWHLSGMRRAVLMLLAYREELPEVLATELQAYKFTLDVLYLETADGFADAEGVLNLLPAYVTGSLLAGLLSRDGTDDDIAPCRRGRAARSRRKGAIGERHRGIPQRTAGRCARRRPSTGRQLPVSVPDSALPARHSRPGRVRG